MFDRLSVYTPYALAVLRIVTALLFIEHGTQKLFGFPIPFPMEMSPLTYVAGILEVVGGIMILVGFMTRPVAFLLCGMMAIAYFLGHFTQGFWPVGNGGDAAILFCFVFGYLVFVGPGAWSFDNSRKI